MPLNFFIEILLISTNDMVVAISQSGETADTLSALKLAKQRGAFVYGICNVVGSSIARSAGVGTYTHAGPEIGGSINKIIYVPGYSFNFDCPLS